MSLDRADWHYGGDFPENLEIENAGTHIGMYLAWIINNNLEGDLHKESPAKATDKVRAREMTGRTFFFHHCDGKFWKSDLNEEGFAFTNVYYINPDTGDYGDYLACLLYTSPSPRDS